MLFPRKSEVLDIHRKLLEQFGGPPGLRDEGLLDSALLAAENRRHYEGADLCGHLCLPSDAQPSLRGREQARGGGGGRDFCAAQRRSTVCE